MAGWCGSFRTGSLRSTPALGCANPAMINFENFVKSENKILSTRCNLKKDYGMKSKMAVMAFVLLLTVVSARANDKEKMKFSYWVVENNSVVRGSSLIKLYDCRNELVREIRLEGIYLDLSQKKHRKLLERKLREAGEQDTLAAHRSSLSWS